MKQVYRYQWFSIQPFISRRRDPRRRRATQPHRRRLRFEPLEDRRLLAVVTINTLDDTVDFNDVVTSLREALFATNLVGGADTIEFATSLTSGGPATLTLTQGELKISDALVINGPGANLLTIDASGNDPTPDSTLDDDDFSDDFDGSRVFNIDDGNFTADKSVSIFGLTLTGGDVYGSGGAIYSRAENLTITGSTISGNSATFGGGILTTSSDLTVADSTISDNSAVNGSGINSNGDNISLTVTNSAVSDNVARGDEGGISSSGNFNNVSVSGSTISGNSALGSGAGISVRGYRSTLTVNDSTISGNSAGGSGGGIFSDCQAGTRGNVTVTDSTISDNSADNGGGGIFNSGHLTVSGSTISGNSADSGGGIYSGGRIGANVTVTDSTISDNLGGRAGGGIASRDGQITVTNSTVSGNSATGFFDNGRGGGIWCYSGDLTVTVSTISGNSARGNGGGIYSRDGDLTVTDSTISDNSSDYSTAGYGSHGGGIFNRFGPVTVIGSTIVGNSSVQSDGGGIGSPDGRLTITNSTISGNSAVGSGGGIANRYGTLTVAGSTISYNSATDGGGIWGNRLTVTDSTISGNSARDDGGGIFSRFGGVTMVGSTVSGNSARDGSGGGVFVFNSVSSIRHSTVPANTAYSSAGGGAFIAGGKLALDHTILARNSASLGPDLTGLIGTVFDVTFSLIGNNAQSGLAATPPGTPNANGNRIGTAGSPIDPLLGPLADNGGPTLTHALLAGSPAIDAGDPSAVVGMNGVPEFDQRGNPFIRVVGAAIDVGAFELEPAPPALFGDYNHSGVVDAADYSVWRDTLHAIVAPYSGADGSGNGVVDQADCSVWKAHFGQTLPPLGAGNGSVAAFAQQPSVLSGGGTAAALTVSVVPKVSPAEALANELPARSARGAALPTDAVFALLGQRTPARSMAAGVRTALRSAAVDSAVLGSLLLVRHRRSRPTQTEDSTQSADQSWQDADTRLERTRDVEVKWRTVVRGPADRALIVL